MHRNFQDPARATTLRNRTRSCNQGLDVRNSLPPIAQGEVFFLDIPFYRTRKFKTASKAVPPALRWVLLMGTPDRDHHLNYRKQDTYNRQSEYCKSQLVGLCDELCARFVQ